MFRRPDCAWEVLQLGSSFLSRDPRGNGMEMKGGPFEIPHKRVMQKKRATENKFHVGSAFGTPLWQLQNQGLRQPRKHHSSNPSAKRGWATSPLPHLISGLVCQQPRCRRCCGRQPRATPVASARSAHSEPRRGWRRERGPRTHGAHEARHGEGSFGPFRAIHIRLLGQ